MLMLMHMHMPMHMRIRMPYACACHAHAHAMAMRMQVASGVAYLHSHGVMHRDVKSANVLLDESRHAKVQA